MHVDGQRGEHVVNEDLGLVALGRLGPAPPDHGIDAGGRCDRIVNTVLERVRLLRETR